MLVADQQWTDHQYLAVASVGAASFVTGSIMVEEIPLHYSKRVVVTGMRCKGPHLTWQQSGARNTLQMYLLKPLR